MPDISRSDLAPYVTLLLFRAPGATKQKESVGAMITDVEKLIKAMDDDVTRSAFGVGSPATIDGLTIGFLYFTERRRPSWLSKNAAITLEDVIRCLVVVMQTKDFVAVCSSESGYQSEIVRATTGADGDYSALEDLSPVKATLLNAAFIDSARDILVGKVPDPKSQVEQITIALIYKFMDDMDAESEEMGGSRKFFANDYARYGWAKLMRSGLGGHETLNLYAEAIAQMPDNPGIPALFREIFKNAYLPYRDPETLRAFLKIIDEFEYDHSERLGDAFEYLLSVLGSQGDAGQFRTPRHIIDFMVAVLDPKKSETVLDPACGTAGFLISSYKHILRENIDSQGNSTLSPDERGMLAGHITGYDISPDMVRLSLVNLYLHGFIDPHIFEYDTLTSQERWGEYADVILANPPFMSPKGGIKPHNRFSVQSKRSEVLFVDYMAEHLTPSGRAGIIVPEGVIFQSGTAYKQLRKLLVEESLVAVVSLPAGVFNPYSGVKTSILILDKALARRSLSIGFFDVANDGFGLGTQRRGIELDDLPTARAEILEYLRRLRALEPLEEFTPKLGLIVTKETLGANGDYNLSIQRYREALPESARRRCISTDDARRELAQSFGGRQGCRKRRDPRLLDSTMGRVRSPCRTACNDRGKRRQDTRQGAPTRQEPSRGYPFGQRGCARIHSEQRSYLGNEPRG
jgi:type I restriction-modification system DNA methylase subunit